MTMTDQLDTQRQSQQTGPVLTNRARPALWDATPHLRPHLHFTARDTWLNDPNGLITHHGTHHLFFQNNPADRVWGNMSWGHATSPDLFDWTEQEVAITGDTHEAIFSGSAVWDRANSTGFGVDAHGDGPLVAVFTSAYQKHPVRGDEQAQSLAYSLDDGATWTKYEHNPVLARGSDNFRDPKVIWHEPTHRWVMVAVEAMERQVLIHTSEDLTHWELASTFGPAGATEGIWECPDLLQVPVVDHDQNPTGELGWVLLVSVQTHAPAGGSGMQWFTGDFNGQTFTAEATDQPRWFDLGTDMYAAVSFNGTNRVIGWMSNWSYADSSPTSPWASAMTLPREISLVREGAGPGLRHSFVLPNGWVACVVDAEGHVPPHGAYEIRGTMADDAALSLSRRCDDRLSSLTVLRTAEGVLVERTDASEAAVHTGFETITAPLPEGPIDIQLVEDHGLIEMLFNRGRTSVTVQTFPVDGPLEIHAAHLKVQVRGHGA